MADTEDHKQRLIEERTNVAKSWFDDSCTFIGLPQNVDMVKLTLTYDDGGELELTFAKKITLRREAT